MRALVAVVLPHLRAQVQAGAQALQLFDSWVGALDPSDYEQSVLPHTKAIFEGLADLNVPLIHFGVGTAELLPLMSTAGCDVIGLDWRTPIGAGWQRAGGADAVAVQGNLDPATLLGPRELIETKARAVLDAVAGRDGHIFNLGHGVMQQTAPEALVRLVDLVHEETAR